ncbi:MAG: PAS domain S-box protein [Bacteroidales bacterium]|nr:PAS domain S-box protein [Bacteroidales bacterium]
MLLKKLLHRLLPLRRTKHELKTTSAELSKFRLILDQAPAAVYIINKSMRFEYINPHFTQISGYTTKDLLNNHINDTIYKREISVEQRQIAETLQKGETWQGELLSYHKNGQKYWANTIASPYKNENGEIDGYIIIQQDVTEHKNMDLALKESENLYRTLIENSLDSVVLTQDFRFLYFNKVFQEMMGYSHEELLKIEPTSILAPEDRERIISYHTQRMKGEILNQTYKAHFVRKDGNRFLAEMMATSVTINGKLASFITLRDITEHEALQNALRENEAKYKVLVENSQDGILIVRDNKILFANRTFCDMLGYSTEELYKMPAINTIHPDETQKALDIAKRRSELDFSTINEVFRMVSKTGEIRECETSSTMIEYGGIWASFFTSHDITENKRIAGGPCQK